MVTKNEITHQEIKSRASSKEYRDNYDRIFRNKDLPTPEPKPKQKAEVTE